MRINSNVKVNLYQEMVSPSNALGILKQYDIILDCTDNAPTRYLLSDATVLLGKPLVSGAAQRYDGQLCVYNLGEDGPCYRCLFPKAPEPEFAGSCQETGILGAVTGVIGNLQALEAIKLVTGLHGEKPFLDHLVVFNLRRQMGSLHCSSTLRSRPHPSGQSGSGRKKTAAQRAVLGLQPLWMSQTRIISRFAAVRGRIGLRRDFLLRMREFPLRV